MTGKILSIHKRKMGNGTVFQRVTFKLEDGKWAKTDICPQYRNFERWRGLLKEGAELTGLDRKAGSFDTIDADCHPKKIKFPPLPKAVQIDLL